MVKKATSQSITKNVQEDSNAHTDNYGCKDTLNSHHIDESSVNSESIAKKSTRRKISKAKSKSKKIEDKVSRKELKEKIDEEHSIETDFVYCEMHPDSKIEFMCINPRFVQELCSYCILDNKEHINDIFSIKEVVELYRSKMENESVEHLQDNIIDGQSHSLRQLENISERIMTLLRDSINSYKERLIFDDEKLYNSINNVIEFKDHFMNKQNGYTKDGAPNSYRHHQNHSFSRPVNITNKSLQVLKDCIKNKRADFCNGFVIEEKLLLNQIEDTLQNNISYVHDGCCVNSTAPDIPKVLHWFEWEKRDLHLFNVSNYTHNVTKLVIPFKIAPFSRSIMVPDGRIYLMGGEDKNDGAKRECYVINPFTPDADKTLSTRANMPLKKYDFTLCYLLGHVYTICGKNVNNDIVESCECYDIEEDTWRTIAPVNKKRYAATAATIKEKGRIYIFGGRGEAQNAMIAEIEEYTVSRNEWKILEVVWPHEWKAVEVCAAIQVQRGEIIVFGGSDVNVEDSKESFILKADEVKLVKSGDLKKPHVFVSAPFVYGNHVFAVGNEYYVKTRNVHRYNIQKGTWDIVF